SDLNPMNNVSIQNHLGRSIALHYMSKENYVGSLWVAGWLGRVAGAHLSGASTPQLHHRARRV
ncbi:12160_t:CDS:1, partial [Acaulospora colombiana]